MIMTGADQYRSGLPPATGKFEQHSPQLEVVGVLIAGADDRLDSIRSRAAKLKTMLAIVGYAPEFSGDAGDVLWMVREQIDLIEALAQPVAVVMLSDCVSATDATRDIASVVLTQSAHGHAFGSDGVAA